jgi:predicted nuclease of predicted toxin-antitoxin system
VDTVGDEDLTGPTDSVVMGACRADGRMLMTFDVGFGNVHAYQPGTHNGIVLLRLADQRPDATLDVLRRFLIGHALDELAGALIVVSDDRVRIRRFEP